MIIGRFTKENESFTGSLQSASLYVANVGITRVVRDPKDKSGGPDYQVAGEYLAEHGHFEIGAGWLRKGEGGKAYLSIKLDSPAFADPINCALTKQADGSYALVWRRRKPEANTTPVDASEF